jgi:general L-amino acid transport system substrate-binding protein
MVKRGLFAAVAAVCASFLFAPPASAGPTIDQVRARGQLVCGIHVGVAGFALPDSRGTWQGLDVDLCRGLAVAIFNDPNRVRLVPLSASQRFTALGSGEIDVLFRTSTQTMLRDTTLGIRHVATYFYDGHGFMVKRDAGITRARDMGGASICLVQGTTNEQVTADYFRSINVQFRPVVFERNEQVAAALQSGRCDAYGHDASQLAAMRSTLPNSRDWVILDETFSKEPYGAYVRRGDEDWFELVRWYTYAIIEAEEQGITRANAEEQRRTTQTPNTRRLLGVTPELGQAIKLEPVWAYNVIRAIGNYGELYDRHFGPETPIAMPRGQNRLWTQGGLMYAWPLR